MNFTLIFVIYPLQFVLPVTPSRSLFTQVASSFSHMLNLHNLTEEVNSSQTERAVRLGEVGACGQV